VAASSGRVLYGDDAAVVLSDHGGCRGRHWSNQRCGVIRCCGLGLAEAKRASLASWDGYKQRG
jgi:hypothetical protein